MAATWTKDGIIITLTSDTLMSELLSESAIVDGDQIEFNGNNLIVDADARSVGVKLTNTGSSAHLEFQNGGAIKLNQSGGSGITAYALPTSIFPWVNPENPLPESNYTAGLYANASAEIQLNGNIMLGGGEANLPTRTREGNFWALVDDPAAGYNDSYHLTFNRDINLHPGDKIGIIARTDDIKQYTVKNYDSSIFTVETEESITNRTKNNIYGLLSGGICLHQVNSSAFWNSVFLSANMTVGTLNVISETTYSQPYISLINNTIINADRLMFCFTSASSIGTPSANGMIVGGSLNCNQLFCQWRVCKIDSIQVSFVNVGECVCQCVFGYNNGQLFIGKYSINGGINSNASTWTGNILCGMMSIETNDFIWRTMPPNPVTPTSMAHFINCTIDGENIGDQYRMLAGTATKSTITNSPIPYSWLHVPASNSDTTWRYGDYTVKPQKTLRIRGFFKRYSNASISTGAFAITDQANWYPTTKNADSEAIFSDFNSDWQIKQIEWKNTSDEDAQVRVWECVTGGGTIDDGAYLRTMETSGGPM